MSRKRNRTLKASTLSNRGYERSEHLRLLKVHTFGFLPMKEDYSMGAQHQRDTLSMTAMPGTSLSR
jgi:hypothetical protein